MSEGSVGTYLGTGLTLDALQGNHIKEGIIGEPVDEFNELGLPMTNIEFEGGLFFSTKSKASNELGLIYSRGFSGDLDYYQEFLRDDVKLASEVNWIDTSRLGLNAGHFFYAGRLVLGLSGKVMWPLGSSDAVPVASGDLESPTIEFQSQAMSWRAVVELGGRTLLNKNGWNIHAHLNAGIASSGTITERHFSPTGGLSIDVRKTFSERVKYDLDAEETTYGYYEHGEIITDAETPPSALPSPPPLQDAIEVDNSMNYLSSLADIPSTTLEALKATAKVPEQLNNPLVYKTNAYSGNTLFFDYKDQGDYNVAFTRISAFQDTAPGQVLPWDEVTKDATGSNLKIETVAAFFNAMKNNVTTETLSAGENKLREFLLEIGVLFIDDTTNDYTADRRFYLVGTFNEDNRWRDFTIDHEFSHTRFYFDNAYNEQLSQIWDALPSNFQYQLHIVGWP